MTGKAKRISVPIANRSRTTIKDGAIQLRKKIEDLSLAKANVLLSALLKEYIEYISTSIKETTKIHHWHLYYCILRMFPDSTLVQKISTIDLQEAFNEFYKDHSYGYTKQVFSFLKRAYKYGVRMGYLTSTTCIDNVIIKPKPLTIEEVKRRQFKVLDSQELVYVLESLRDINPRVAALCEFQSLTGLRFGEMVALRECDLDLDKKIIDINGTLSRNAKKGESITRGTPKNIYSVRTVSLSKRALEILNSFISYNKVRSTWHKKQNHEDYIFLNENGLPYDNHFVNKVLKRIPFDIPLTTHIFRHTHISMLAERNVPLKAIMERVGHNEPRTTLSIYTHVTKDMKKQLNDALESLPGKALN